MSKSPADSLRKLSDGLQSTIDDKFRDRLENTHKRAREAESQREDGRRLQKVQDKLRALADAWDAGTLPPMLKQVTTKGMVDRLTSSKYFPSATHDAALYKAFVKAGIPNQPRYDLARETLLSLGDPNAGQKTKEDQIREAKAALLGLKFNDFFPTPDAVVERMLELAEIEDGMKVWEPSAGWGNIADAIKARYPSIVVEVTEVSYKLREILALKGHKILEPHDCLEHTGRPFFDRILMNPPFSNNQDIAHVRHAYTLLKPGGRLVAVMCEHGFFGNEKACQEFRDWYPEIGFDEELPDGAFLESERSTGVKTRLIVLEKPTAQEERIINSESKPLHPKPDKFNSKKPVYAVEDIHESGQVIVPAGTMGKVDRCGPYGLHVIWDGYPHGMLCIYSMVVQRDEPPICDTCGQPNRLVLDDAPVGKRKCWTCLLKETDEARQKADEAGKKVMATLEKMGYTAPKSDEPAAIQVGSIVRRDEAYIGVITSIKDGRCHGRITQPLDPRIKSMKHFASAPQDLVLVEAPQTAIVPVSPPVTHIESTFQWFRLNDEEREDLELAYKTYVEDVECGENEPGWQFPLTASEQINFENFVDAFVMEFVEEYGFRLLPAGWKLLGKPDPNTYKPKERVRPQIEWVDATVQLTLF